MPAALQGESSGTRCTGVIRIYSYEDKNFQGTFFNPQDAEEAVFSNLTQLLFLLDRMLDAAPCPEASAQDRRFAENAAPQGRPAVWREPQTSAGKQALATFTVHILFRQNATWQGKLGWREGRREETFRSALELVALMDSVLPQCPRPGAAVR